MGTAHGTETLREALWNHCETVLGQYTLNSNARDLYAAYEKMGLGEKTGVGFGNEASGNVLELKYVNQRQLVQIGYGQSIGITPMQYASALGGVFNGGVRMQPHIIHQIRQPGEEETILTTAPQQVATVVDADISRQLAEIYAQNVKNEDGNGRNAYIAGYRVGGAAGIAPKPSSSYYEKDEYTANFFAFAPADAPRFLVVVVVDAPEVSSMGFSSQIAAPAARTVLHSMLKQKHVKANYEGDDVDVQVDIPIPNLVGRSLEAAQQELDTLGLHHTANGNGTVVAQIPSSGSKVPSKTGVLLFMTETDALSLNEHNGVTVPNLQGLTLSGAYKELSKWGLEAEAAGDRLGFVAEQVPSPGVVVPPETKVVLTLKPREAVE